MEATSRKESWFRTLKGDRLEVHLVGNVEGHENTPVKVRASGPSWAIWRTVDFFEDVTGLSVEADWRRPPRSGQKPMAGQLDIMEQLESSNG